jgi:hypothetical protein
MRIFKHASGTTFDFEGNLARAILTFDVWQSEGNCSAK